MAAGVLLVEEAGGRVCGYGGEPWSLLSEGVIASGPGLFDAVRKEIRGT
jgi:fructose-1,6-bisphosphatase/inositol monophosphatase family enzyme